MAASPSSPPSADLLARLPTDMVHEVLARLDAGSLRSALRSCRALRALADGAALRAILEQERQMQEQKMRAALDRCNLHWVSNKVEAFKMACADGRVPVARRAFSALGPVLPPCYRSADTLSLTLSSESERALDWYEQARQRPTQEVLDGLLVAAVIAGNAGMVAFLVGAGADPNVHRCGLTGVTVLHDARARGLGDVAEALMRGGANVDARDVYGQRAADVARDLAELRFSTAPAHGADREKVMGPG